ncbi:hypothetical protein [Nocardia aurantiaca]|nr:hypothetical protein [Nocardia aurantiaca]
MIAHCRERLADFEAPGSHVSGEPLPRNADGKLRQSELRRHAPLR